MIVVKCGICKKEFWARGRNNKYCSDECRKKASKISNTKGATHMAHVMDTYKTGFLALREKEAREHGLSYGHYQAQRQSEHVRVERKPKSRIEQMVERQHSTEYEFRKQQFNEIVAQVEEIGEKWENQSTIGTE